MRVARIPRARRVRYAGRIQKDPQGVGEGGEDFLVARDSSRGTEKNVAPQRGSAAEGCPGRREVIRRQPVTPATFHDRTKSNQQKNPSPSSPTPCSIL